MRIFSTASAACLTLALCACGGGGGSAGSAPSSPPVETPSPASPAGLWTGTLDANRTLALLVLPDASYQLIYSKPGAPGSVGGIAQGAWTAADGAFSSAAGRDFNFEGLGASSSTIAGAYAPRTSLSGSIGYPAGRSSAFSTAYAASSAGSPALAAIAGVYSGQFFDAAGQQDAAMSVSASGLVSALNGSCELSGTASARADANAYQVALSFSGAPCLFAGQSFSSAAYVDPATKRLVLMMSDPARAAGLAYVGTKG